MKKQKRPALVTIGILTLITILFWVGFSVYRVFTVTPPLKVPDEILAPITPTLDTESLEKVSQRVFFEEEEIGQILIPTPAPTPTPVPTGAGETATQSATPATESAELQ